MILSFHPCFETDRNIICAGRKPDEKDLTAIKAADAVILPQGCPQSLYEMAVGNCANVFPNLDVKFKYPGKIGQAAFFNKKNVAYPNTQVFMSIESFIDDFKGPPARDPFAFPFVFKFDWGGEGQNVYLINNQKQLNRILKTAQYYEKTGQAGFLIQEFIPSQNRSLRVVIIGRTILSYWRIQENADRFCANLSSGAVIDKHSEPDLQKEARRVTRNFCNQTNINLAGFDFLFSSKTKKKEPLFLEINFYFGRKGLGGSEAFYKLLNQEIREWLTNIKL